MEQLKRIEVLDENGNFDRALWLDGHASIEIGLRGGMTFVAIGTDDKSGQEVSSVSMYVDNTRFKVRCYGTVQ